MVLAHIRDIAVDRIRRRVHRALSESHNLRHEVFLSPQARRTHMPRTAACAVVAGRVVSRGVSADRGPWIDLHGHAGRCFLAGLPAGHPMVASLGAASVAGAVRDAAAAGMTALTLATVSDLALLRPDPVTGLRAHRDFRPGEAQADHRRQLDGLRRAAAAAGARSGDVSGRRGPGRPRRPHCGAAGL